MKLEESFYDSKGNIVEKRFWATMMNNMTNERLPERQFCLASKSLITKMERQNQMTEEEIRITKEVAETENKLSKLKKELEKISISEEKSDEEYAVTQETEGPNMISDECTTKEGVPINIVYSKGQIKK